MSDLTRHIVWAALSAHVHNGPRRAFDEDGRPARPGLRASDPDDQLRAGFEAIHNLSGHYLHPRSRPADGDMVDPREHLQWLEELQSSALEISYIVDEILRAVRISKREWREAKEAE